jgi:hypothetical protein
MRHLSLKNYDFGCEFEIYFEEDIRFFYKTKRNIFIKIIC